MERPYHVARVAFENHQPSLNNSNRVWHRHLSPSIDSTLSLSFLSIVELFRNTKNGNEALMSRTLIRHIFPRRVSFHTASTLSLPENADLSRRYRYDRSVTLRNHTSSEARPSERNISNTTRNSSSETNNQKAWKKNNRRKRHPNATFLLLFLWMKKKYSLFSTSHNLKINTTRTVPFSSNDRWNVEYFSSKVKN